MVRHEWAGNVQVPRGGGAGVQVQAGWRGWLATPPELINWDSRAPWTECGGSVDLGKKSKSLFSLKFSLRFHCTQRPPSPVYEQRRWLCREQNHRHFQTLSAVTSHSPKCRLCSRESLPPPSPPSTLLFNALIEKHAESFWRHHLCNVWVTFI